MREVVGCLAARAYMNAIHVSRENDEQFCCRIRGRIHDRFLTRMHALDFWHTENTLSESLNLQNELNFGEDGGSEGYTRWLVGRQVATEILARKMGLPLGHEVEIWLIGGLRLRGKLRLQQETLFIEEERVRHLELRVDKVAFTYREMESCVRLD